MSDPEPGVQPAPPAEPAAPAAPNAPPVREDVTTTGKTDDQSVPFSRFQEVNDKAKTAEENNARLEEELVTLREQQNQTPSNEEELDPDVLDLVKKSSAKLGLVSKEELDAREAQIQVRQDMADLTSRYKDSGIPFDGKKVIEYAKANGMQITSQKSLDAIYKEMNYDAIIEGQRKAAVTDFQEGAKSGGEKAGSEGAKAPAEQKPGSLKDRIKAAREKAGFQVS